MIQVSEEYKKACKSPIRQSYNIIKYGLYNKEAKTKINSYSSSSNQIFSNIPQIYDENKEKQYDYISCEKDRVILNNNFVFIKDKTKIKHPLNTYEIGLCNTKAGIPYHDPNLSFDSKDIMELREYEFRHSDLMSSSKYMKIRSLKNE